MRARHLVFFCTALCIWHVAMAPTLAPRAYVPAISYYHSLNLFGRSANFVVCLSYGVGTFLG
jgi:hypothetical protein